MTAARILIYLVLFAIAYTGSYLNFRSQRTERWSKDGHDYVVFPKDGQIIYYVFRPLTYLDSQLTGMRFHIGPHQ